MPQCLFISVQGLGMVEEIVGGTGGYGVKRTASGVTDNEPPKKTGRGRGRGRPPANVDPADSPGGWYQTTAWGGL